MKRPTLVIKLIMTAAILLLLVAFVWIFSFSPSSPAGVAPKVIRVADRSVTVSIADTLETRERGLGGRTGLNTDEGMLFVFPKDASHAFWMKDMQFSIDIIWLSADGTVITIAPDVSPATYPHSFAPSAPARYVLELSAGFSKTYNLKVGDRVQL